MSWVRNDGQDLSKLTLPRVQQWMNAQGFQVAYDEGALVAAWGSQGIIIRFDVNVPGMLYVQAYSPTDYPSEQRMLLLDWLNLWNREADWPKVSLRTDDGKHYVVSEMVLYGPYGVADDVFDDFLRSCLQNILTFYEYIASMP